LNLCLETTITLQLTLNEAEAPPDAARGIEGLREADHILREHRTLGLLIGSVAKHIWLGIDDIDDLSEHRDIDIVILSSSCDHHPKQWEGGIDWWVRHSITEAPTNGTGHILRYLFSLEPPAFSNLPYGLYVCPRELVIHSIRQARFVWGNRLNVYCRDVLRQPNFTEFDVMPFDFLRISWFDPMRHHLALHCKPE
jgi:hypothetical protein